MKPTEEQIKEFWEWCGLEYEATKLNGHPAWSIYGDERKWCETHYIEEMGKSINLNNLFKYAIPKLGVCDRIEIDWSPVKGCRDYTADVVLWSSVNVGSHHKWTVSEDPALALFWAIWEVIHGK